MAELISRVISGYQYFTWNLFKYSYFWTSEMFMVAHLLLMFWAVGSFSLDFVYCLNQKPLTIKF